LFSLSLALQHNSNNRIDFDLLKLLCMAVIANAKVALPEYGGDAYVCVWWINGGTIQQRWRAMPVLLDFQSAAAAFVAAANTN
jgi:hypothetical protein